MATDITDYSKVADRASELGCAVPTAIAILPVNFETAKSCADFKFNGEAATIRKLLRQNGISVENFLPNGERAPTIHNKHFEWAPLLFISAALTSNDPYAVTVALGIISNYATEYFRGILGRSVKLDIVVERKKDNVCKKLHYEGDIEGLASLPKIIQDIADGL